VLPVTPRGSSFFGLEPHGRNPDYSSTTTPLQPRSPAAAANPSTDRSLRNRQPHPKRSSVGPHVHGALTAALALSLSAAAACTDSLRPLGTSPAAAQAHADQLFEAFATRFSPSDLSPRYDLARVRLAQGALIPSRVFNDTSVWESRPTPSSRLLYVSGSAEGARYRLETRPSLTPPARPGDTRHVITLEELENSGYGWDTRVDLALGSVSAEEISLLLSALFRAPEGRSERELREEYRSMMPHAAAAFGHGFSIDSLHLTAGAPGITNVAITAGFHPETMKATYPLLAGYLDKYLGPAKYHFVLADRAGAALLDVSGRNRALTLRYRLEQGKLTTLYGPAHAWPDTLRLTSEVSLKVKLFTVGFHEMVSDFVLANTGHERAWTVVTQREPKWDLPFITERLIRSPLRRPFEGAGATVRLSVHDSAGAQTVLSRRVRLEVQESAIMRFLGSLAAHALSDLDTRVEQEEDRFLHDGFVALQADLRTLAPRWR
jgi:hypothetical protein